MLPIEHPASVAPEKLTHCAVEPSNPMLPSNLVFDMSAWVMLTWVKSMLAWVKSVSDKFTQVRSGCGVPKPCCRMVARPTVTTVWLKSAVPGGDTVFRRCA